MDKVVSFEQLQGFIGEIRNLRQGFVTNFFWNEQKHPYWVESGSFFYERFNDCYILIHDNKGFSNLYYIATGMNAFEHAYLQINFSCDNVIDIVCKKEGKGEIESLVSLGFEHYKTLYRMSHLGLLADDGWDNFEDVICADETDCDNIYKILQKDFDPLSEQLPSLREVYDYITRKQILLIKDADKICGFIIFEISGITTWYLRYWYTSPDFRNKGIGSKLLKMALKIGQATKRQQLWVISNNENAIKRYEHYGFYKEPINNYVMIKQK